MTRWSTRSGLVFLLLGACGSNEPTPSMENPAAIPRAGAASPAAPAVAGAAAPAGRAAPVTTPSAAGRSAVAGATAPTTGTTSPGAAAGSSGGVAGTVGSAGTIAPAAGSTATDAGGAGAGGSTGAAGEPAPGDAFAIRGSDPTEQSANGRSKGPYAVESYTSGYMRGDFSDATMWYPTSAEAKPPFGCVAVVPGFVSPQASIRNWGPFLASHGIVTITIGVPGSDQPSMRAASLMSALETCLGENERADSPLKGKLSADHLGLAGWSMGGGGTLIAASRTPTIKAAVSFAAWGPTGGGMNKVPVLMFEATADPLAASMSDGYYRQTPDTTPKMLFEVQGSSHNVANDPANHDGIIGLYGLSWFKVFLEGDTRYKPFLLAGKPGIATDKFATNLK